MTDLKPCPFCGGTRLSGSRNEFGGLVTMCDDCEATGPSSEPSIEDVKAVWNARAPVKVKPLVWTNPIPKNERREYLTECGRYKIVLWYDNSGHVLSFHRFGRPLRIEADTGPRGVNVMKAAAQADHERRIREWIE